MKLIDVAEFYAEQGGGVKTYLHQKLRVGSAMGHDISVLAPGPETCIEDKLGGRILWVKSPQHKIDPRYHVFDKASPVHDLLDSERPDVLECSSPWRGAAIASSWQGRALTSFFIHQDPVAVYPQTFLGRFLGEDRVDWLFGWFWRYLRRTAAKFDTAVVSGEWLAARLGRFGLNEPFAAPFGIEKDQFAPALGSEETRREMLAACGVNDPNAKLLISVSRHHPEKRLGMVMDGFEKARRRRPMGLYLIGDGPFRKFVEKKAALIPHVHVAGLVPERALLAKALASADAMVHGGAAETFGLVIAEGLSAGAPLVVPSVGGAADLAAPEYAEFYRPGDSDGFAAATLRLLGRDPKTLKAAVAKAVTTRILTPEAHFERLFGHYETLLAERRAVYEPTA
ncbi:MAG: glycosyltransferase [Pseudomonadota bacterium]